MVREGNRNLRSGLRVKSASDVENLCTCRESRQWGTICAHALAVGLAYIEREPAQMTAPSVAEPLAHSEPHFIELGSESATPVALHFILPPQFDSAWAKQHIMIVIEAELDGKRAMLSALSPSEVYGCDTFDLVAIDGLTQLAGTGALLAAMRMLSREDFLRLLDSLGGHPRVTFGKSVPVEISQTPCRPKILLQRGGEDEIILQLEKLENQQLLAGQTEAWSKSENHFTPCVEGLPAEFLSLADGPLTLRGERALRFLAFDAPRLENWFEVEVAEGLILPEIQKESPQFALNVEGSIRELRAELQCRYAGGPVIACALPSATDPLRQRTLQSAAPLFSRDPKDKGVILLRDLEAEAAAVQRLRSYGFTAAADKFVMRKENLIARFFAFEYPRLKSEWKVTLSAQAEKCSGELQPLAPAIDVVASGENWFELRYSLASSSGETIAASELQRLLRSGQNQTRLRNGRVAVFDAEAVTDFEEVLRDCEPSQSQPGVYRIDRAHAGYITATAQEAGARIVDLRGALERLTSNATASQAETLKVKLGKLGDALREYQLHGVAWLGRLAENGLGGILADEMGLGKTVQALAFLSAERSSQPALIVCPSSLLTNWRNEAQRFTPELKVLVLEGPSRHERFGEIAQADIVITSYALLQRDAEKYKAIEFSSAILDEAQHIKNPETQNAQTAFALRARHRFVLTGTPIENSVRDLWSLMNFAVPGYLGSRSDFRERYEQPLARGPAPEVQRRLARRMRPFLLRRKKTEVAKDLPEKIEQVLSCDLSSAQRSAYDGLLREIQLGVTARTKRRRG